MDWGIFVFLASDRKCRAGAAAHGGHGWLRLCAEVRRRCGQWRGAVPLATTITTWLRAVVDSVCSGFRSGMASLVCGSHARQGGMPAAACRACGVDGVGCACAKQTKRLVRNSTEKDNRAAFSRQMRKRRCSVIELSCWEVAKTAENQLFPGELRTFRKLDLRTFAYCKKVGVRPSRRECS